MTCSLVCFGMGANETKPFGPGTVAGCAAYFDASLGYTPGTGAWVDQTGNGNNLAPVSGIPAVVAADAHFNGQATLSFVSASSDVLKDAASTVFAAHTWTAFVVSRWTGSGTQGILGCQGDLEFFVGGGVYKLFNGAGPIDSGGVTVDGNAHVLCISDASGAGTIYQDNVSVATGSIGTDLSNGITVGALTSGSVDPIDASYAMVIVYDHVLSSADRTTVSAALKRRFGTP